MGKALFEFSLSNSNNQGFALFFRAISGLGFFRGARQTDEVGQQPVGTGNPGGKLAEQGVGAVDVVAAAQPSAQQPAAPGRLAGVSAFEQGCHLRRPFSEEIEAALLLPAGEILGVQSIRKTQERVVRCQQADGALAWLTLGDGRGRLTPS